MFSLATCYGLDVQVCPLSCKCKGEHNRVERGGVKGIGVDHQGDYIEVLYNSNSQVE